MKLGHYELLGELGRGGMGVVYRARDPLVGREVAVKVLQPQAADADSFARLQREAQTAGNLRHPGIVPVLAAGVERGRPYLVMELVQGESLRELLRREGRLGQARAAGLVAELARALQHAHERGVLHRDVKPENVLLGPDGRPRLTDFGLAALQADGRRLTRDGEVVGTPCYMAPEQAVGDRAQVGPRSDVYGLGATLYELVAGQPPLAGASALSILEATVHGRITPPRQLRRDLDPALEEVILKALARDPAARWSSAGALAEAVEGWAAARRARPARGGPARGAALAVGAAAAAAVVALGLGVVLGRAQARGAAADEVARLTARVADLEARLAAAAASAPAEAPPARSADEADAAPAPAPPMPRGRRPEVVRLCEEVEALVSGGDLARALEVARRAQALDPDDPPALNNVGSVLLAGGDAAAALGWFDRALAAHPGYGLAAANRSLARQTLGDIEGARDDLDRALAVHPDDARLWHRRGACRDRLGDSRGGLADLTRALELDPSAAATWRDRGTVRERLGDHRGAMEDHDRALALAPDDPVALANRGVARAHAGDLAGGAADLERALALGDPTPAHTLANLGALYQMTGDHARAVEALTRSLELDAAQPVVLTNRGISRGRLGDHRGAADDCARALERLPAGSQKAREAAAALAEARAALGGL
ncbi:MAG: serine/threonine-protein kinase [Planctomycetes bacterium]|nr:serine/threonine-protein kinase [Planctomycetota bacterium]